MVHCIYKGVTYYNFQIKVHIFLFALSNSVDPDEMLHYATFHLGLHVLQKYSKPVLRDHSKIDKTNILMMNDSLMKVESIAEGSPWSIL